MSVIGLKVGPFEVVRRAWVPGPGRWYLALGDGEPSEVLVRVVSEASGDEHRAVQHQFEVLRDLDDPRVPTPIGHYGTVPGSPSVGALAVVAQVGAPLSDAVALRGDESVVMTPGTLLDLLQEVAEVLERAHERGRIHGHLDPHHVVLGPDGRVWIHGFGTTLEEEPRPEWIAPEQARGGAATAETDQWALGALALGLVLGHPVWRDEDPRAEAVRGDTSGPVDAVGEQWAALGRVLARMTDLQPEGRYPSMTEVREDLAELVRIAGGRSDREGLAATLCARRQAASAPEETDLFADPPRPVPVTPMAVALEDPFAPGGAPTAVPLTDEEEPGEVTDAAGFFGEPGVAPPGLPPAEAPEKTKPVGISGIVTPDRRSTENLPIVRLATVLAGTMVALLVVWLFVNLF